MWKRLKAIHPGWVISAFFALLIAVNIAFFTIAFSEGVQLIPEARDTPAPTHETTPRDANVTRSAAAGVQAPAGDARAAPPQPLDVRDRR